MNFIKRIEEVDNLEIGNKALNLRVLNRIIKCYIV